MNRQAPIGVFDSGIGGLTVLRAVHELLPDEPTIYFGDTARVPYGSKSRSTIERYSLQAAEFLIRQGVKLLVVACNTASAVALKTLETAIDVPVVGVIESAARRAAQMTRTCKVGVIGTRATVASRAYEQAIRAHRPEIEIHAKACPLFVPLAEEGWTTGTVPQLIAQTYLAGLRAVDTLVLGCTHYPLLAQTIRECMAPETTIIDSATETARDVAAVLERLGLRRAPGDRPALRLHYVSDDPAAFALLGERFFGLPVTDVVTVSFEE